MRRIKIIALTADSEIFKNERLLDKKFMLKFPGMSWIPIIINNLKEYKFTTTDVALNHVENGYWEASDIGVIQHLDHSDPTKLISLGARPLILMATESPVYAARFFNDIANISIKFPKTVLLEVLLDKLPVSQNKNYILRYPSFFKTDIPPILAWKDRSFMLMVVRNMYNDSLSLNYLKHPIDVLRFLYRCFKLMLDRSFIKKPNFELKILHDKRIEAIIFFGERNRLELFGYGWENIKNLPMNYQKKLSPILNRIKPTPIEDKITKMSNYKFAICFENGAYKGGVSEKIIDCFLAGVIPVYLGATNIEEFVPVDTFIDVRLFNTWEELYNKLENIQEEEAHVMLSQGRKFLETDKGKMHSYEGFASFMQDLIIQVIK